MRCASEERQAFLLKLSDAVRSLDDRIEIQQVAMRLLGEQLKASRAFYFLTEPVENNNWIHIIETDYRRDADMPSHAGRHSVKDFGLGLFDGAEHGRVVAIEDVTKVPELTKAEIQKFLAIEVVAFINVPLIRNKEFVAGIGAHHANPHTWTPTEIELIREVAARVWFSVERACAEGELRESEQKYQALFAASPVPLFVLSPEPPDYIFLAANDAYLAVTMKTRGELIGRRVFDVFTDDPSRPDADGPNQLRASLERTLASKQPDALPRSRYDIPRPDGGFEERWWLAISAPVLDASGRITSIIHQVTDVTQLHLAEAAERENQAREAFLLKLSDRLRPLADPVEVKAAATRLLAEQVGANRAFYVDAEGDHWAITKGYERGVDSLQDTTFRTATFAPWIIEGFLAGHRLVVRDMTADLRFESVERAAYLGVGTVSEVAVPLVKDAVLVAVLFVQANVSRDWTERDLTLVEEAAERTWAAVERAKAEAALRQSEAWLAGQKEALQAAINGAPLAESLGILARTAVEWAGRDAQCGFYLADYGKGELVNLAGMSSEFAECVNGIKIGPDEAGCGLAVHTSQPVITADVLNSPRWEPWRRLAEKFNFRGVWSFPLETAGGKVVGTFALYFSSPQEATPRDHEFAAIIGRTAGIIIAHRQKADEGFRVSTALRHSEAQLAIELADSQQLQHMSGSLIEENKVDGIYDQILDTARALMNSDMASLQQLFPERQELLLLAQQGWVPESAKFWEWVDADETTSCGMALSAPRGGDRS